MRKKHILTAVAVTLFAAMFWACAPSKPITTKETPPAVVPDKKTNQ